MSFFSYGQYSKAPLGHSGEQYDMGSQEVKLLYVPIDNNLTFNEHLSIICKKENSKVTALARIVNKRVLMKALG